MFFFNDFLPLIALAVLGLLVYVVLHSRTVYHWFRGEPKADPYLEEIYRSLALTTEQMRLANDTRESKLRRERNRQDVRRILDEFDGLA